MTIQMKIEAKQMFTQFGTTNELKTATDYKNLYGAFSKDIFQLPYKVRKLSKKARRQN